MSSDTDEYYTFNLSPTNPFERGKTTDHDLYTSSFSSVSRKLVNGTAVTGRTVTENKSDKSYDYHYYDSAMRDEDIDENQYQSTKLIKTLDPQTGTYTLQEWEADCHGNGNLLFHQGSSGGGSLKYKKHYDYCPSQKKLSENIKQIHFFCV